MPWKEVTWEGSSKLLVTPSMIPHWPIIRQVFNLNNIKTTTLVTIDVITTSELLAHKHQTAGQGASESKIQWMLGRRVVWFSVSPLNKKAVYGGKNLLKPCFFFFGILGLVKDYMCLWCIYICFRSKALSSWSEYTCEEVYLYILSI